MKVRTFSKKCYWSYPYFPECHLSWTTVDLTQRPAVRTRCLFGPVPRCPHQTLSAYMYCPLKCLNLTSQRKHCHEGTSVMHCDDHSEPLCRIIGGYNLVLLRPGSGAQQSRRYQEVLRPLSWKTVGGGGKMVGGRWRGKKTVGGRRWGEETVWGGRW